MVEIAQSYQKIIETTLKFVIKKCLQIFYRQLLFKKIEILSRDIHRSGFTDHGDPYLTWISHFILYFF